MLVIVSAHTHTHTHTHKHSIKISKLINRNLKIKTVTQLCPPPQGQVYVSMPRITKIENFSPRTSKTQSIQNSGKLIQNIAGTEHLYD